MTDVAVPSADHLSDAVDLLPVRNEGINLRIMLRIFARRG